MTYPPHQPDGSGEHYPYWQNPYWQDPAWQQHTQPAPSWEPLAQPFDAGSPQQPPEPPRRSRAGLWAGIAAVAASLAVFLVLAFVAPGFLLDDGDRSGRHASDGLATASRAPQRGARATAEAIVAALDHQDVAAVRALVCAEASAPLRQFVGNTAYLREVDGARLETFTRNTPVRAVATVRLAVDLSSDLFAFGITRDNGGWCWQYARHTGGAPTPPATRAPTRSQPPPSGGATQNSEPDSPDVPPAVADFVTAVNSGDVAAAEDLLCTYTIASVREAAKDLASSETDLEVLNVTSDSDGYLAYVAGMARGRTASGYIGTTQTPGGGCVLMIVVV